MSNFLKALKVKGIEIDTAGAITGDVLKYDGSKFGAASAGGGSSVGDLDDLTDVVITTPYKYQSLIYDGTNWVNDDASTITYVSNAETTTLNVGEVVYLYQQQGDRASVKRAINTSDATSAKTLGVVAASIAANVSGPVVTQGYVTGCTLGSFTAGQTVYLGATAGTITSTKPYAPNHLVYIGVVVRANNGNGILYVRAQNGYELDEIHDVDLTTTPPTAGQYLKFGGTVWTADTIDLGTDTTGNYMSGISGTSPVSVTHTPAEGSSATVALASNYGDTQNPYASKTANHVLAAPNGSNGVPTFRALASGDIPYPGSANQIIYKNGSNVASGESAFSYYDTTNTLFISDASYQNSITSSFVEILETAEGGYGSSISPTALSIGGNGLYFNVSNNRLGVGTSSPASALDVVGDVALTGSVIFEGATANTYETTLSVTDPTADRTITLPNASGTVALIAVSDTAPASPVAGNLWYKSDTGAMYVYYDSFWIEVGSPSSGLDGGSA